MALGGCASIPSPPPPPIYPPADADKILPTRAAVERMIAADVARLKLPSLSFGVVTRGGLVYFLGFGARDGEGTAVTQESVFRIGSITKTITGMAILKLRDEGKLGLDDPVVKYVPELAEAREPTTDSGPIRIRHLVTHSSGLPRLGKLDYGDAHEVTRTELRLAAESTVLDYAPGTRTVYSNLAMALAGLIVARVSGERYRAYVERNVLAPLGMTHTVWDPEAVPPGLLAKGWAAKDGVFGGCGPHWRLGAAEAMGGLYSNVADMARYVAFHLSAWPARDGADAGPLQRSTVRESHLTAGFTFPGGESFGVNWILRDDPSLGHVVFHNGGTEGYHATIWMVPERGVGVVALGPATGEIDGIAYRALEKIAGRAMGAPARAAFGRVRALLVAADRGAVERSFAPSFLKAIPVEQVVAVFARAREGAGACTRTRIVKVDTPETAELELDCEKGGLTIKLSADPSPPHLLLGLEIRPR
jgi:CubicO group peptidase (beta-lactamase class C family)